MRVGAFLVIGPLFVQSQALVQLPFLAPSRWADSVLAHMSLEEKIGQLFMVPAYSSPTQQNRAQIERWIREYHIGGLIFMKGTPLQQVQLTNAYQRQSAIPLLIAMDAEWGPSMRLDSLPRFPYAITLGALQEDSLVYQVARAIGRQCKRLGVHINFAPVADVNNNPANPVIGFRAFGSNKHSITQRSLLFMHGLQDEGVLAVAKHFPGHGDTQIDSHYELPILPHSLERLDSLELYPFRNLIREGIMGIMVGHLLVPALDTFTATVSQKVIQGLLREKLGFRGIVFSDALNMKAVSLYYAPGELEVAALKAGADVLLYVENLPVVFRAIQEAVFTGRLSEEFLDEKVRRLLQLKAYLGLTQTPYVPEENLYKDLWAEDLLEPLRRAFAGAVTLLRNRQNLLPLSSLKGRRPLYIQIGYERPAPFYRYLTSYSAIDYVLIPDPERFPQDSLTQALSEYNLFIVGLFGLSNNPKRSFGMRPRLLDLLCELTQRGGATIACVFGNPYALSYLGEETAILLAYQEDTIAQWQTANVIFGASPPRGKLPIEVPLPYGVPPSYDPVRYRPLSPYKSPYAFKRLDSLLQKVPEAKLAPGLCVTVIYRDTVVYNKGWGTYSYEDLRPVSPTFTLYDVASLTKVFVTTLAAMNLYEQGRLHLMDPLGKHVPSWQAYPIGKVTPYQLLTHTAGYPPILRLLDSLKAWQPSAFSDTLTATYPIALSRFRYARLDVPNYIWQQIRALPPKPTAKPVYSDIGFIILGRYLEKLVKEPLDIYVTRNFYEPMGLYRLKFYPAMQCLEQAVPPTEIDTSWRRDTLRGYVHDPIAALMGGVSGHAGLFASSQDLAYLSWLFLKEGEFAGFCYLSPNTIRTFTQEADRLGRGLGWDKPSRDRSSSVPEGFSRQTFGHLGFTGTAVWIDPQRQLIVVILSNRTYPSAQNSAFNQEKIRRQILEAVQQDLKLANPN